MAVSAAEYYEVRWRVKGNDEAWSAPRRVSPVSEVVIEELDRNTQYEFEVRAVSNCGAKSIWVPSDYTVPGAVPPTSVDTLTAQPLADGVHLGWTSIATPAAGIESSIERSANGSTGWAERARVRSTAYTDPETSGATYYYRVRYVNFAGQFGAYSPIVSSNGVNVGSIGTNASNALADAAAAQADADAANAALADIASDGILSPVEKPVVIRDYNVILAEQAGIDAQATAYGITTQKTAYDTAVSALTSYLGTLTAPVQWSDLTGNTTIVGATFRSKFADVYTTRQALLNAIYAAAKAKADAAQATADAANANVPAVINGAFKNGTTGWTFDNPTGFSQASAGSSPDSACPTYLTRTGQAGGATTYARNLGYVSVVPGQSIAVMCCAGSIGANAGAYVGCRISWRDAAHAEVATTLASVTAGPGGTYLQAVSKAAGQAPSTAFFAHFELYFVNHSSGVLTATSCVMSVQPSSIDEVPDGSTYARAQAFTMQNGVIVPFGDGDNLIPNHSFANNESASPAGARAIGQSVCDGWLVGLLDSAYMSVLYEQGNPDVLLRLLQGVTVPASTTIRARVYGTRKIPVTGGETLYVAFSGGRSANQTYPAGVTLTAFGGLHIYNAAGTPITDLGVSFDKTVTSGVTKFGSITLPSTAAYAVPMVDVTHATGGTSFSTAAGLYADVRISDLQIVRQLALETAGSGRRLGDMRNQVMVGVGNYGAGWSGGSITYSATTTSATITAAAATLQLGSSSLAYNSANVTVSGSAGLVRTYYLYYDDDGYTGGSKTLNATTSQITSLSANGRILVGQVTVTFPTSGTGSGGGGAGCPDENAWVLRADPEGVFADTPVQAKTICAGHYLRLSDGRIGLVTYAERKPSSRVRVIDENGESLTCSTSAPLELFGAAGECVVAPASIGRCVAARAHGVTFGARIWRVEGASHGYVQHITCENACFWTGDDPDYLFGHHNLKPPGP